MILEGLKSGDSRLAQQALAEHIETARLDYLRVMKEKNITEDFGMLRFSAEKYLKQQMLGVFLISTRQTPGKGGMIIPKELIRRKQVKGLTL